MAQVNVTIAGRQYRMACADGQEAHLLDLAETVNAKIAVLRQEFGEIGDQRITMMAAITIADDLSEAGRRIAELERELEALRGDTTNARTSQAAWTGEVAASLAEAATRIERVVVGLKPPKSGT
jgi:cell division protein ZapA